MDFYEKICLPVLKEDDRRKECLSKSHHLSLSFPIVTWGNISHRYFCRPQNPLWLVKQESDLLQTYIISGNHPGLLFNQDPVQLAEMSSHPMGRSGEALL